MDKSLEKLRVMWGINKLASPFVSKIDMMRIERILNKNKENE